MPTIAVQGVRIYFTTMASGMVYEVLWHSSTSKSRH